MLKVHMMFDPENAAYYCLYNCDFIPLFVWLSSMLG